MGDLLDYAPIAAAAFAIPQFLPQILKLRATDDTAGVSWSWAALTSVNNAAWFLYFALASYWTALVPASSATLLAGTLAIMLALRGQARARPAVLIGGWVALLLAGFVVAGRSGLGTLLTVAFILQVTPSIWTAYRTAHLTGVARGTWLLILGELSCWTIFGVHKPDPRLLTLGVTGITASGLMLARIRHTRRDEPLRSADADADPNWSPRVMGSGSSVGLLVGDLEPDVGVAELAGPAPARQVLAGQLLSGRLDELGVLGQIAAEPGDGLLTPEGGDRVGIAPARRTGDNHRAGRFAPPWLAAELHPPGRHGTAGFIGGGARPAARGRRLDWVAARWSRPPARPPGAGPGRG